MKEPLPAAKHGEALEELRTVGARTHSKSLDGGTMTVFLYSDHTSGTMWPFASALS